MRLITLAAALALLSFAAPPAALAAKEGAPVPGLSMYDAPKYPSDFKHLGYVNPDAPKGGTLRLSGIGGFDSLNPWIVKGLAVDGTGMVFETLLEQTVDEPFSAYGLLAETVETPEDRSFATFTLRPQAKWQDGEPVTAQDVVWSFKALTTEGTPFYRAYYAHVKNVEALSPASVKFTFDMAGNRELPLIVGQMPVLPEHYFTDGKHKFAETTLTPIPGSGPYKFGKIVAGRSIEYLRVKDWWGADLPINRGRYNFDRITYDYYKDAEIALEAFFAGEYDFRQENVAKQWAISYDAPPVKDGRIVKKQIAHELPQGMQGFIYNLRRPVFADREVRRAIAYAFDFEWSNKQFAYGAYKRSRSYFSNSEMEAKGVPQGRELEILEPFRKQLPPELFTEEYNPPATDGSGNGRANLKKAAEILDAAGWKPGPDGIRQKNGVKLAFEIVDLQPAFERWILPFTKNLDRLGIKATFRVIDASQLVNRMNTFDYDMTVQSFPQSNSPGNEQREFWGSDKADMPGSRNMIGIKDPVVDALIEQIVSAPTREELVLRCRALDRVLQWGYYLIPNWHIPAWRIAYWNKFGQPGNPPPYALPFAETWWTVK